MTPVLQHQHFMLGLILSLLLRNLVVAQAQQGGWTPAGVLVVDPTESDQSGIGSNRWKVATRGEVWSCRKGVESRFSARGKKDPRVHREKFRAVADFFSLAVSAESSSPKWDSGSQVPPNGQTGDVVLSFRQREL